MVEGAAEHMSDADAVLPASVFFMGTYSPKLDPKGRVILPAKFATGLQDGVVITRGQERCLYLYPKAEFTNLYQRMQDSPASGRQARDTMRLFLAGADDEELDAQRRVTIPSVLRSYASLTTDLAVIGVGPHVEIWDATTWEDYVTQHEQGFSENDLTLF